MLDDGGEVDLDLGNYERFLQVRLHRDNNITTGLLNFNLIKNFKSKYKISILLLSVEKFISKQSRTSLEQENY